MKWREEIESWLLEILFFTKISVIQVLIGTLFTVLAINGSPWWWVGVVAVYGLSFSDSILHFILKVMRLT